MVTAAAMHIHAFTEAAAIIKHAGNHDNIPHPPRQRARCLSSGRARNAQLRSRAAAQGTRCRGAAGCRSTEDGPVVRPRRRGASAQARPPGSATTQETSASPRAPSPVGGCPTRASACTCGRKVAANHFGMYVVGRHTSVQQACGPRPSLRGVIQHWPFGIRRPL